MPVLLFGGIRIATPDGETETLPTRKTAQVLGALALPGEKGLAREALAESVWPDRSEAQAKSSLRQALTAIRKALPSILDGFVLEADLESVRLAGPAELIDARLFESLADSDAPDDRVRAATLYAGDLLDNVQLSPPLDNLVISLREQYRRRALTLVEILSEDKVPIDGSRAACLALADRLLATDPAAEEAHRAVMRIRIAEGQPNAARRQLERCTEAVAQAFGTGPEEKTTALLDLSDMSEPPVEVKAPAVSATMVAPPEQLRSAPSVVVMPFDDLGAGQDDFFADGVVEEITAALSRIRDFFVIARQSAFTYKGRFVDAREVGRDLGVRYAVEGTVRRGGERVRINVQLIETETGTQLWSDRFEGDTTDIFDLQDRIASHVAGAINPSIRASEIELSKRTPPENLQAYDFVLRAFPHFWAHRKKDNQIALELFEKALERDPEYGLALALKAWCHAQQACYLWADDPGRERANAIAIADKAALHVHDNATALTAIGAAYSITTADYDLAKSFIDRSLTLDPNNAWGWMRAGWLKSLFHRSDGADECFERAKALSPFDPFMFNIYFGQAAAAAHKHDFATAIELTEKGLRAGPGVTWAYRMLANFHGRAGDKQKSTEALAQFMHYYPGVTMAKMLQGLPPGVVLNDPEYWEGIRKAGIPES